MERFSQMKKRHENMNEKLLQQHKNKKYTFLNCTFWDIFKFAVTQKLSGYEPRQEIK